MTKHLFLFDIDGTLIDSGGCGRKAINAIFEELYSVKDVFNDYSFAGRTDFQIAREGIRRCIENADPTADEVHEILDGYAGYLEKELQNA